MSLRESYDKMPEEAKKEFWKHLTCVLYGRGRATSSPIWAEMLVKDVISLAGVFSENGTEVQEWT